MKIATTSTLVSTLVGLNLFYTIVMTLAKVDNTWCRTTIKRNWRFPRPVPQIGSATGSGQPFHQFGNFPDFRRPFPAHLPGRAHVILYQHEHHNGLKYEQTVGPRCYNLPNIMNDQASSIDTDNRFKSMQNKSNENSVCIMVCKDKDCHRCKKINRGSPGHARLSEIGMDDAITAIKPCGEIYE